MRKKSDGESRTLLPKKVNLSSKKENAKRSQVIITCFFSPLKIQYKYLHIYINYIYIYIYILTREARAKR